MTVVAPRLASDVPDVNYSDSIKHIQGKSVPVAVKDFARSLGSVFARICEHLQSLSLRVENLESSRQSSSAIKQLATKPLQHSRKLNHQ